MPMRYYNGEIGRFISQDPAFWDFSHIQKQLVDPQSWNSYSYARNNPLKYNDPNGDFWDTIIDAGFTAWDGSMVVKHSGKWLGNQATIGLAKLTGNEKLENIGRQGSSESASKLGKATIDLSIDVGATLIPGVPAFIGRTDDVAKFVNKANKGSDLKKILSSWRNVNKKSILEAANSHLEKHGAGRSLQQYTQDGIDFYNEYKHLGKPHQLRSGETGLKIRNKANNYYGIYDSAGKQVSHGPIKDGKQYKIK